MRLISCSLKNFGSYGSLDFDFEKAGLALVHGPTGAGKSTLLDAAPWVLFGITSKNGNVDDIRSWNNPELPAYGKLILEVGGTLMEVVRIRGEGAKNDLYWNEMGESGALEKRGKDIKETQALLEARLGISSDLYLSGAYYHEFNPVASFFVATAKYRRTMLEQIAPLEFAAKLSKKSSESKKLVQKVISESQNKLNRLTGTVEALTRNHELMQEYCESWGRIREGHLAELRVKAESFEETKRQAVEALTLKKETWDKAQLTTLDKTMLQIEKIDAKLDAMKGSTGPCPTCGVDSTTEAAGALIDKREMLVDQLSRQDSEVNPYVAQIEDTKRKVSDHAREIAGLEAATNPHTDQAARVKEQLDGKTGELESCSAELTHAEKVFASFQQLYDLSLSLRGALLSQSVQNVQNVTNELLETHFDGEFRVKFSVGDSDDIDVEILKNGNVCYYRQLSKGQRQLLKLCFTISVMGVASNNAGVGFKNLFFDEAFDGLDAELKVKAYGMFEALAPKYDSIMVVDHSTELKSLFLNKFKVYIQDNYSVIEADES